MLNELSTMEVMELMEKLERIEPVRFVGSVSNTIDLIFSKAFGFDWEENQLYKELRVFVNSAMFLTENQYNDFSLMTL